LFVMSVFPILHCSIHYIKYQMKNMNPLLSKFDYYCYTIRLEI